MEGVINMLVEGWDEILKGGGGMSRRVVKHYKHSAEFVKYTLGMCLSSHMLTMCYGYSES